MPGFIKTPRDEHLWAKAKARAAAEGKTEQWPYITGIFKHMKGGSIGKTAGLGKALLKIFRPVSNTRLGQLHRAAMATSRELEHLEKTQFGKYDKATTRAEKFHQFKAKGKKPKESKWAPHVSRPMLQGAGMDIPISLAKKKADKATKSLEVAEGKRDKARNLMLGGLVGAVGAGVGAHMYKKHKTKQTEQIKEGSDDKGVNWKRLLGISAASGVAMGLSKGLMEKRIETAVRNLISKRKHLPFKEEIPWSISRGATGGIGALAGATSMGIGLGKDKKKKVPDASSSA